MNGMKKWILMPVLAGLCYVANAQAKLDSLSYSAGVMIAQSLKQQGLDSLDLASFQLAVNDVLKNQPLAINVATANQQMQKHRQSFQSRKYEKVIAEGKKFMDENGKRKGVVTLPSGLQYEVINPGSGPKPAAKDKVSVHYHGTLLDGTVFDSSVDRKQPATFGVTQVIPGWVEGLQLMPEGAKWKLFIPSNLAYGDRGAGPKIGPYSTLIFEVELLKINP
jgi:FKBP-type peptidyl-prolyl cis-trans isomerase FklB